MESEAHASEPLEIEYAEVKQEPTEVVGESFGVEQPTWEWEMEDYENKDGIDLLRIKDEQSDAEPMEHLNLSGDVFDIQETKIKLENDVDIKSEVIQIPNNYIVKDENDSGAEIVLDRIKNEQSDVMSTVTCDLNGEAFNMKEGNMKLENDLDVKSEETQISHEYIIKDENESGAETASDSVLKRNVPRKQGDVMCRETKSNGKLFSCYNCKYTTCHISSLIDHMEEHENQKKTSSPIHDPDLIASPRKLHSGAANSIKSGVLCTHCNSTFQRGIDLDDHIVKKHPDYIASISRKIHECDHCTYKTTIKKSISKHMLNHPGIENSYKLNLSVCIHCNAAFKDKLILDNHIIRKHPDFTASVTRKIHECAHCTYKTTLKQDFARHILKHSGEKRNFDVKVCIHCNATFAVKVNLEHHIIQKHPDFIASVTRKIHECKLCTYKTTIKSSFVRHMLKHPAIEKKSMLITCVHCNATFKYKINLDDHILKKHPDFTASVTLKIHACIHCPFKTTLKRNFDRHMLTHSGAQTSFSLKVCNHTFKDKINLDDHIIKKHSDFTESVTRKIHECVRCTYKTTLKKSLAIHMFKHPDAKSSFTLNMCIHCNAKFRNKINLDDHVIRKHPEFTPTITRKILECVHCTYKTTIKVSLVRHIRRDHRV